MYQISPMINEDIPFALSVWHDHFERYCKCDSFPDFWNDGQETVVKYLSQQIEKGNAIVANLPSKVKP